ncbi:hypothetical protein ES708_33884 [subsurface metagenome]
MGGKDAFHLIGADILATPDDDIIATAGKIDITLLIFIAQIAGAIPAVGGKGLLGLFLVPPVALHYPGALDDNFPYLPGG